MSKWFIFRIHNYVMSFVFFIASEHIQTVGQVLTPIIDILYTKYWSFPSYSYSLSQVLVWHQL
jgi:hypothetical protein